jgi:DNA-binding CsgD family transcriptional regulator/tetratricopeptide (TPR) repeat protein
VAYDQSLAAGQEALEAGRWLAARESFGMALADRETAEALAGMGTALWWLGEIRGSLRCRERAYTLWRRERRLGDAAALALEIAVCYLSNLDNDAAARGWIARARRAAAVSDDRGLEPWVWLMEGYVCEDHERKRDLLSRALEAARTSEDADLELVAMADLGLALVSRGAVDDGLALLDEAMAGTFGGECRRLETVVWNSCSMLAACSLLQDHKRATEWCGAADAFTETYGCPFLQARCRAHYGRVLVATGDWDQAERELDSALSMASDLGREPRAEALAALADLRLRQGQADRAEQLLEGAADGVHRSVVAARVLMARGHADRAVAVLEAQADVLDERDTAFLSVAAALTEAYLGSGDVPAADRAAQALERAGANLRHAQGGALCARATGLVAGAMGRRDEAARLLRQAATAFEADGLPFEAATSLLDLAGVVLADNPALATVEAGRALTTLELLGARHDAGRAASLLRALGVPPKPGPRGAGLLSRREQDVLDLVKSGLTNPQIAAQLYISRKTVAHHVSSILTKLNLTSRAEAAAYAVRVGTKAAGASL